MTAPGIPHVLTLDSAGLGDRSYVVHDGRHALVVDPQRDIDRVERLVAEHGLSIAAVAETHFHNDYVSGGIELARKHGAEYVVPAGFDIQYDATQVNDGDAFTVGDLEVEVIHTPGHSPGSVSLWCAEERALFSADAIPIPGDMPIYQDILASVQSIQRLKRIEGIGYLLSAWDEPRAGGEAYRIMGRGLEYLQHIHKSVLI